MALPEIHNFYNSHVVEGQWAKSSGIKGINASQRIGGISERISSYGRETVHKHRNN